MTEPPKLEDLDPVETREWLESIDSVLKTHGPERAHYLLERLIDYTRRSGAYLPFKPNTAYVNSIPAAPRAGVSRQPRARAAHRGVHPLERARDGARGQQGLLGVRRPPRELRLLGDALRGRLQSLLARAERRASGRHGLHPGTFLARHLRARLPRGAPHRGAAAALPPGSEPPGRGAVLLPASVADAGLLAVSDGVHGPGSHDGDLPGALHALPRAPRTGEALRPEGLGVPRRRRDGRAGVDGRAHHAGARGPRQPHLRHQLQPAAPRRAGARQRQDHPGARGGVPRRRLERHQGAVGLALGSAAGARPQGAPASRDGGERRRRVPELQGQGRRVHARALLRQVPRAQGDGRQHVRRGDLAAEPRRPRPAQGVRGLRRGHGAQGAADRDPRQDRQGLRPRQGRRGPDDRPPAEEARRGGPAHLPRPLQHPGGGRGHRQAAVQAPGGGHRGDALPQGQARRARRLPAEPAAHRARARHTAARGLRGRSSRARASARSRRRWRSCACSPCC